MAKINISIATPCRAKKCCRLINLIYYRFATIPVAITRK